MLDLKILLLLLLFASGVYSEWSKQHDKSARRRRAILLTAAMALAAAVNAVLLVSDHRSQAAAVAAAQEEAAEARNSLQGVEESVAEVVAFVREQDPGLTEQEALDRVVEELRELRERSADLEDQLTGLQMYGDVSELDVLGTPDIAGEGLSWTSPLSQALEGTWDDRDGRLYMRCDQTVLGRFHARDVPRPDPRLLPCARGCTSGP